MLGIFAAIFTYNSPLSIVINEDQTTYCIGEPVVSSFQVTKSELQWRTENSCSQTLHNLYRQVYVSGPDGKVIDKDDNPSSLRARLSGDYVTSVSYVDHYAVCSNNVIQKTAITTFTPKRAGTYKIQAYLSDVVNGALYGAPRAGSTKTIFIGYCPSPTPSPTPYAGNTPQPTPEPTPFVCSEGQTVTKQCPSGSEIVEKICQNNEYISTGNICSPYTEPTPEPSVSGNNNAGSQGTVQQGNDVLKTCRNGALVRDLSQCPSGQGQSLTNDQILYGAIGVFVVLILAILLFRKR